MWDGYWRSHQAGTGSPVHKAGGQFRVIFEQMATLTTRVTPFGPDGGIVKTQSLAREKSLHYQRSYLKAAWGINHGMRIAEPFEARLFGSWGECHHHPAFQVAFKFPFHTL